MSAVTSTKLILGREPAFWSAFVMAIVAAVVAFGVDVSTETQGLIQAFVNAVLGAIVAAAVRPVSIAAFVAVVQTALPLLVAFGLDLTTEQQGVLLTLAPLILNLLLVRPQATPTVKGLPSTAPAASREATPLVVEHRAVEISGDWPEVPFGDDAAGRHRRRW
ncbi:hypothetical protein DW322_21290 [Rhodococcus rhodnii]|uniref:Uncharacterized protein n=2 Tax=Rhodococcus rhodnii TaxID=38312 RepID=R7WPT5_9NOCA|nr:hypothetical protein [Rhodococcus rhodnii]EOM77303.1 hypothetical protein Rrhod_1337 [Rhodococcus rhodnii LMG 5362]TXG88284.1 hypothetical protein DW322_21620 [Rhodococcus rhodnii]TXG88315.1 hypothetical protein DW322_21370 [Rhodococcus rhodnii]TXG89078.1 hypothetical protein DW322_00985 [Rhodococcus rhodnii]TXG92235.1 hypothetical protein DW322_21290 [Rhodococcus rhodnii]